LAIQVPNLTHHNTQQEIKQMDFKTATRFVKTNLTIPLHSLRNQLIMLNNKEMQYTQFHSQFGEDRYIFHHVDLPEKGVFVDVGAGHPISLSNTYFFEQNGWRGICIDADPTQYELLKKERKTAEWVAISSEEGEIEFSQCQVPELSSTLGKEQHKGFYKILFNEPIRVPAFKLETMLEKHHIDKIDILSLDVEGTELEVWKSFNFEKHKPKVVIIEYWATGLIDNTEQTKEFFSKLPYKLIHTTCANFIYLLDETIN
jgi:FkbM family methyltransferase